MTESGLQLTQRLRYRLCHGLTSVFLWPAMAGFLVFALLAGIAGGSTEGQPQGLVLSRGRVSRVDPALWDALRVAEQAWPVLVVLLILAASIFVFESRCNRIVRVPARLRFVGPTFLWMWVAISAFVLAVPVVVIVRHHVF